jgi:hypothetical protein
MRLTALLGTAGMVVLAFSGDAQQCQSPREMRTATENLTFLEGAPGAAPPGRLLGPYWWNPQIVPAHEVQIVSGQSCNGSRQCATVHSVSANAGLCLLYQIIHATQYRGKKLIYRADVRADVAQGSLAWFVCTGPTAVPASSITWAIIRLRTVRGRVTKSKRQSLWMREILSSECN